jgi:hypothetical protein
VPLQLRAAHEWGAGLEEEAPEVADGWGARLEESTRS